MADSGILAWMLGAVLAQWAMVAVDNGWKSMPKATRDVLGMVMWCAFADAVICWAFIVIRAVLTNFGWLL